MSLDRFKSHRCEFVRISAPMVRYSKLAFRSLVRLYEVDLAFSPMIMADSFVRSQRARDSELTTNAGDRPLIVQLASHDPEEFALAAQMVAPFCDGVDLNCGCPQRWAIQEGIGCALLRKPQLTHEILSTARRRVANENFSVTAKIRLLPAPEGPNTMSDLRTSLELCRRLEHSNIDWLTVHARTPAMRGEPADFEMLSLVRSDLNVPVVANGDVCSLEDAQRVHSLTGCSGVMSARGLLSNPALFAGCETCPLDAVRHFLELALGTGCAFQHLHHHLAQMLEGLLPRSDRRLFGALSSVGAVLDFLQERLGLVWYEDEQP